jgi:hypothetical protein
MGEDLKCCPFCGHDSEYRQIQRVWNGPKAVGWIVVCCICGGRVTNPGLTSGYDTEQKAKDAWNRRASG